MPETKPATPLKARVLSDFEFGGASLKPDQLVLMDAAAVKPYIASGCIDTHPEAVAYAESLGVAAIDMTVSAIDLTTPAAP